MEQRSLSELREILFCYRIRFDPTMQVPRDKAIDQIVKRTFAVSIPSPEKGIVDMTEFRQRAEKAADSL